MGSPDWASAGPDGTFGNRFDDPDATYRVPTRRRRDLGASSKPWLDSASIPHCWQRAGDLNLSELSSQF